ncbi:hypothetical protein B9Z19DRAFT_419311 [Tuber borchii]|uniref:Uncharacterized protein n=1 Tax=Tuber borchii TaxID=42251 RepID=A0A2T6ZGN8_TUBBO|nr:hypothetical protein B9Z19DRAFT_419311 [Tuber borchii]
MSRFFTKQAHVTFLLAAKQPPRYRFPTLELNRLANVRTMSKATDDAKPINNLTPQEAERLRKRARRSDNHVGTLGASDDFSINVIEDQCSFGANMPESSVEPRPDMAKHNSDGAEGEPNVAKHSSYETGWGSDAANNTSDGGGWGSSGGGWGSSGGGSGSDVGGSGYSGGGCDYSSGCD